MKVNKNLKYSLRRMWNNKLFTAVNLFGLTIGIAAFLVLFIYTNNEKSFDKHFSDSENIYRVTSMPLSIDDARWARSLGMIHKAAASIPDVEKATWFSYTPIATISIDKKQFEQNDVMSVDENFTDLFNVEAIVGNLSEISAPNTVFISESFAQKHFKNENPIGKTISVEALQYVKNLGSYEIRGIVKNTHPKSHFNYEILLSQNGALANRYESMPDRKVAWVYNYFLLKKGSNPNKIAQAIHKQFLASSLATTPGPKDYQFALTPLLDIHLNSSDKFELKESNSKINIGFFVGIAFVILLVSLFNFTNVSIAKLLKRTDEFNVLRSVGATKPQLVAQIINEVVITCFLSTLLALLLVELTKPLLNQLFDIHFRIFYNEPVIYVSLILVIIGTTLLALLFALFFLNQRNTKFNAGSSTMRPLLIGQVAIVIALLASTFLVNKQIQFVLNSPLGYDKEQVVVLEIKDFSKDPVVFANRLKQESCVTSVGFTYQYFGYPTQNLQLEGLGLEGSAALMMANYDYLRTMKIPLIKKLTNTLNEPQKGILINEHLYNRLIENYGSMEALKQFQAKQTLAEDQIPINIVGVVDDFNYSSAHEAIGDFAFVLGESRRWARFTHIRLTPGNMHQEIERIRSIWDEYYPGQAFNYFFLSDKVAEQYKTETLLSRILITFSILGIIIAVISISALSLFISQHRTKEIGIRKVNGAKITEILATLSKNFVIWVSISFIIATPLIYIAMNKWLENFAYKTNLSWWIYTLPGVLALGIVLLTVNLQSWKAATRNPVKALRYE